VRFPDLAGEISQINNAMLAEPLGSTGILGEVDVMAIRGGPSLTTFTKYQALPRPAMLGKSVVQRALEAELEGCLGLRAGLLPGWLD
jgi:hypothetical protein